MYFLQFKGRENALGTLLVDNEYSLISAKNKRGGDIHAWRETQRTRDTRGALKIRFFGVPLALRVLRVSSVRVYFSRSLVSGRN